MQAQQMYEICAQALACYVHEAGFEDVVIGLSGGIDSSVVAVMAADALGAAHVHGVLLPGPYSSANSVDDAAQLAANLGVETCTVSICEPFEAFEQVLGRACGGKLAGLAAENTQARCRMVCLMALSNAHGWMMLNTGNKSEAMMGYSTLYGDTAGAFAPIGGLYKTDVYAVARWRNAQEPEGGAALAPIPANVFIKPPSAELSPGQSDEASMGISYDVLDRILVMAFERGLPAKQVAEEGGFERAQVDYVLDRAASYAYKRAAEPPFPLVPFYTDLPHVGRGKPRMAASDFRQHPLVVCPGRIAVFAQGRRRSYGFPFWYRQCNNCHSLLCAQ